MGLKILATSYGYNRKHKYKQKDEGMIEMETKIFNELIKLSIPCHVKGFDYLQDAVLFTIENPVKYQKITKNLYPDIAEKYNDKPSRVERAMQHAIQSALNDMDNDLKNAYFGRHQTITNGMFVSTVAKRLQIENNL